MTAGEHLDPRHREGGHHESHHESHLEERRSRDVQPQEVRDRRNEQHRSQASVHDADGHQPPAVERALGLDPLAQHSRSSGDDDREAIERPLRPVLLNDPDGRVGHRGELEQRVAPLAEDEQQHEAGRDDRVEEGEHGGVTRLPGRRAGVRCGRPEAGGTAAEASRGEGPGPMGPTARRRGGEALLTDATRAAAEEDVRAYLCDHRSGERDR